MATNSSSRIPIDEAKRDAWQAEWTDKHSGRWVMYGGSLIPKPTLEIESARVLRELQEQIAPLHPPRSWADMPALVVASWKMLSGYRIDFVQ